MKTGNDLINDKMSKDVDTSFNETIKRLRECEYRLCELQELKVILVELVIKEKLMPYKPYTRKGFEPNYYLVKQEENYIDGIMISKWLYDFIRKEIKK